MRKKYLDLVRVCALVPVITIHLISRAMNSADVASAQFSAMVVIDAFCRAAVPLFAMCSGAIFLDRQDPPGKLLSAIGRIYFYGFFFNVIYEAADGMLAGGVDWGAVLTDSLAMRWRYQLWYLREVLVMYASVPLLRWFIRRGSPAVDAVVLAGLLAIQLPWYLTYQPLSGPVTSWTGYILYFYLGWYLDRRHPRWLRWILIPGAVWAVWFMAAQTQQACRAAGGLVETYLDYLAFPAVVYTGALFVWASTLEAKLDGRRLARQMRYNFGIYLFHGLVIGLLYYSGMVDLYHYSTLAVLPLYVAVVYAGALGLSWLWNAAVSVFRQWGKRRYVTHDG